MTSIPWPGSLRISRLPPSELRVALDGVQADAAAGQVGHLARRRVPRPGEDVRRAIPRGAPASITSGETPRPSSATTISTRLPRGSARSSTRPRAGLPARSRSAGRLDAVHDSVAQQVRERLGQALQDHPVELGVGAR